MVAGTLPVIKLGYYWQYFTNAREQKRNRVTSWSTCALVCRRWYSITVPHMFRHVAILVQASPTFTRVTAPSGTMEYTGTWSNTGHPVSELISLLEYKPNIARFVQNLTIAHVRIDITTLVAVVHLLPRHLQTFTFSDNLLVAETSVENVCKSGCSVKTVIFNPKSRVPPAPSLEPALPVQNFQVLPILLSLFSKVDTLLILSPDYSEDVHYDSLMNTLEQSSIEEMDLAEFACGSGRHHKFPDNLFNILFHLNALRNITRISVDCNELVRDFNPLNRLLIHVKTTLRELEIYIGLSWYNAGLTSNELVTCELSVSALIAIFNLFCITTRQIVRH